MDIRPYAPQDRSALIDLWHECGLVRPWNEPGEELDRKLDHSPELLFVVVDGNDLVGSVMIGYEGHRGWLNYLAVTESRRRCGLGTALVRYSEQVLRDLGCAKLNLQVRTTNVDVVTFYERLGFGIDDVVSLGRRLTPADE